MVLAYRSKVALVAGHSTDYVCVEVPSSQAETKSGDHALNANREGEIIGMFDCLRCYLVLSCLVLVLQPLHAAAPQVGSASGSARDGQHDFDFSIGYWKTHIKRRLHPLAGSETWVEFEGTSNVRKIWNGRASLGETEADGPTGHIEVLSLRLYDPQAHQWNLSYANSRIGSLGVPPTVGEFTNGRGEFYDSEPINGRNVLVRQVWSDITASSCHFEQSLSADGGKTWEVNWIASDTRVDDEANKGQ